MSAAGVWVVLLVVGEVGSSSGGAPFRGAVAASDFGSCHLSATGLDQQVGDEADGEQADHDEQRRPVVAGDQLARRAPGVEHAC